MSAESKSNDNTSQDQTPPAAAEEPLTSPNSPEEHPQTDDRQGLITKARTFLASPQVRNEDIPSKRRFLAEKGLTSAEIDQLIQELPQQLPLIPPRTYPQPPPSNLPNLLVGVFRIFTWVAGGSAALIFVYLRYLLPRLIGSFQARGGLQIHQRDLLEKLYRSLTSLRSAQKDSFAVLPSPQPQVLKLDAEFSTCNTIDDLKSNFDVEKKDIPPFTLLRCALSSGIEVPTTEQVFKSIETQLPHLNLSQNAPLQETLWQTLSTVPFFHHHHDTSQPEQQPTWSYTAPEQPPPTQYLASLTSLKHALPPPTPRAPPSAPTPSRFQRTLQSLTDLTGYITTETYPLPYSTGRGYGISSPLSNPQQEDLRKEIRALKGLVLNRRTFNLPRPPSTTQLSESVPS